MRGSGLSNGLTATATELRARLILETAGRAGRRQGRSALCAKAPRCSVFRRATWAAHLVLRGKPILLYYNSSAIVPEAKGSPAGQTRWSKALVRHGTDPRMALAAVLGLAPEDIQVRDSPD